MRKSTTVIRFPQSATLFRFCLSVLESRTRENKVYDQDVGNLLDYNPSDTSHWKRGQKEVRSIFALETLARSLDVDIETMTDLAEGATDFDEAWFDFNEATETKNYQKYLHTAELCAERRRRQIGLTHLAASILEQASIQTAPVFIPELLAALPFITLVQQNAPGEKMARSARVRTGHYEIICRKNDPRPQARAAIAREIARIVLFAERERFDLPLKTTELSFFEVIDFSNALLVPTQLLTAELKQSNPHTNLVRALADLFWVPRSMIRSQITHLLLRDAPESIFTEPFSTPTADSEARQ